MFISDTLYFCNIENKKIWDICYSANELASMLTGYCGRIPDGIFSYYDIPKENHISLQELIEDQDFTLHIRKFDDKHDKIYFSLVNARYELPTGEIKNDCVIHPLYTLQDAEKYSISTFNDILNQYKDMGSAKSIIRKYFCQYSICVLIAKTKRIKFDSPSEMRKYYVDNVCNIPEDGIYDFLLSMMRYDERHYDYEGNYLCTRNRHQFITDAYGYVELPLFSMETAKDLKVNKNDIF